MVVPQDNSNCPPTQGDFSSMVNYSPKDIYFELHLVNYSCNRHRVALHAILFIPQVMPVLLCKLFFNCIYLSFSIIIFTEPDTTSMDIQTTTDSSNHLTRGV